MNKMNNVMSGTKVVGTFIGKTGFNLIKIGIWGAANQWTNQQFRNNSTHFIGEMERGANHQARKLKLIKND